MKGFIQEYGELLVLIIAIFMLIAVAFSVIGLGEDGTIGLAFKEFIGNTILEFGGICSEN